MSYKKEMHIVVILINFYISFM